MKYPTNYGDLTWSSTLQNTIAPAHPQIPSRPLWNEKCKKIQKTHFAEEPGAKPYLPPHPEGSR